MGLWDEDIRKQKLSEGYSGACVLIVEKAALEEGRVVTLKVGTSGCLTAVEFARLAFLGQAGFTHVYCHLHFTPEMEEEPYVEAHFIHVTTTFWNTDLLSHYAVEAAGMSRPQKAARPPEHDEASMLGLQCQRADRHK